MSAATQNKSMLEEILSGNDLSQEQLMAAIILRGLSLSQSKRDLYITKLVEFLSHLDFENAEQKGQMPGEDLVQSTLSSIKELSEPDRFFSAREVLMPADSCLPEYAQKELLYADPQNLLAKLNEIYQNFSKLYQEQAWSQAVEIGPKLLSLALPCHIESQDQQQREELYTLDRMAEHGLLSFEPDILALQSAAALFYDLDIDIKERIPAIYQILSRFSSPLYRLYTFAKPAEGLYIIFLLDAKEWLKSLKNKNEKSGKEFEAFKELNENDIDQKLEEIQTLLSFLYPKGVGNFALSGSFSEDEKQLQFVLARLMQSIREEDLAQFILGQLSQDQDSQEFERFMLKALTSSLAKVRSVNMSRLIEDYDQVLEDLAVFEAGEVSIECKARGMRTMEEVDELYDFCYASAPNDSDYFRYFRYTGTNNVFGRLKRDLRFIKQAYEQQIYPLACEVGLRLLKLKFEFLNWDDPLDDEQEELEFYELFSRNLMDMGRDEFDFFVASSLYLSAPVKDRMDLYHQFASLFEYYSENLPKYLETGKRTLKEFKEFLKECMKQDPENSHGTWGNFEFEIDAERIVNEVLAKQKTLKEEKGKK